MILKKNFNPIKVVQHVKTELLLAVTISAMVYFLNLYGILSAVLPFSISAILGSALAIFIAFRNNSSYGRWWEARTLWGGIVNASRILARLIITFTDSHSHQAGYDQQRSESFKKSMVYLCIAWAHALRIHLRQESTWDQLSSFMSRDDFAELSTAQNKPSYLQLMMGKKIYEAMATGVLGGFDSFQMEGQLLALANHQGGCERIKNTPLLRQYDFFTRLFLYTFIILLPFTLLVDFQKMQVTFLLVPISVVISFVFAIIGKVGEVNEDPFENRITDVPLSALCNVIERDLKEMLKETDLPQKMEPELGFLF